MTVALSEILSGRRLDGDTVTYTATEDWAQGRTMFGGFLSALAVVAMRDTLGLDMPLRALQTNFVGPVAVGEVHYKTRLLRQGKSVSQVHCEIYSDDTLAGLVVGVFGAARETQLPLRTPTRTPLPKAVDDIPALPFIPKITPNFLQHVEMRWAVGSIPYMGNPFWESGIYIRAKDAGISPEVLIVMLSDGPPTPCLSHFKGPVMASSVSWSLELPPLPAGNLEEGWFQIDMETTAGSDGYVNQSAKLWTPSGQLASLGYQVVAVYG
ncbi:thioesterase family protein [Limnobacter humi]|uniref:Thioesterase family protein n=1 Tax=Limnobacter humi TaxID=1778671 RepID=A0ABT1WCH2_9BURK|nr:thioesterase family protein [Limnobacter humi]MCQ8895216.1 thioesterase family protein [Limnobacter humi]